MIHYCTCEQPVFDPEHDAGCRRCGLPINFSPALEVGAVFDTPFETGCVVLSEPDVVGNFDGLDSDGVRCSFSPAMVVAVHSRPVAS